MSRAVQEFTTLHPRANVRLEYLHPDRVLESVESGQADLGLVSYPRSTKTLEAEPWREEPFVLVCAPAHPLATRASVRLDDLDHLPLVGFDPDLVIRHELDRILAAHGAEPDVVLEFDNIETIKRAVEIDAGVALLPEPTVGREVAAGSLRAIPLEMHAGSDLVRPLGIIRVRGKPLPPTAGRFLDFLRLQGGEPGGPPLRDEMVAPVPKARRPRATVTAPS
jgi:DNA-binding transcriptional LysR family regulator